MELGEPGEPGEPGPDPPGLRINSKGSRYSRDSSGSWDSGVSVETSNASNPSNLSSPSKRKKQFFKSCTATRDFDTIELHPTSGRIIRVLTNCLNSTWLDVFSGTVVLADMVLTCVDIDMRAAGVTDPTWAFLACQGCLVFYTSEAAAELIVRGPRVVFRSLDWLLDMGIISASLVELFFLLSGSAVEEVRILKLLRICRVMRLIRFIRKAPSLRELRKLMMMFASVIRTLAWSFLFCFIAMTLWSMISVELIHPVVQELAAQGTWNDCGTCSDSFATIMQSNLTFLKTLLAGDSWGQIAVPVMTKQPLTVIIFVGALVSIVYGILNLIVAVIVDAAVEQREKDITTLAADLDYELEEDLKLLGRVFQQVDLNADGELSLHELVTGAENVPEFQSRLRVMDIDAAELEQLFHNEDGGGSISKDEFKFALSRWMRESKTANHFVKYMVSNLSVNQSQLQDQVRQISRAVATLAADASTLRRVEESIPSKLTKTKSSKSLDAATAQTLQVVTVAGPPSPENASQLPTLLQRLDDGHGMEVQAMPDETRPSMSAILQLLQDADALLLKKKRLTAAASEVDRSLKTTLDKASVAMQRWTLLQPGASDGQTRGEVRPTHPPAAQPRKHTPVICPI